jgi:phage shock protein A
MCAQVSSDDVKRIKELEAEVKREEKALAELKTQTADLERKASALQQKIDNAGGIKATGGPNFE